MRLSTVLFAAAIVGVAGGAVADQASILGRNIVGQAFEIVDKADSIRLYCRACGDDEWTELLVKAARIQPEGGGLESLHVGEVQLDLAYTYVLRDGIWENLAIVLGVDVESVPRQLATVEQEVEHRVAQCWKVTEEERGSSGPGMRTGTNKTIECLQDEIVAESRRVFASDVMPEQRLRDILQRLRDSNGELYGPLYNQNRGCTPSCGTMYYTFPAANYAALLKGILRDMVAIVPIAP